MTWLDYCGVCYTVSEGTLRTFDLVWAGIHVLDRLYYNGLLGGFKRRYRKLSETAQDALFAFTKDAFTSWSETDEEMHERFYLGLWEDVRQLLEDAAARHGYVFETEEGDGASYVLRPTEKRMPIVRRFYE